VKYVVASGQFPDPRVGVAERCECWALAVVVADPLVDV
jgi:hypothetical protein